MKTMTSRQFSQNIGRAKRAAEDGPVFITRRGQRSHVLLTIEDYLRLSRHRASVVDQLAMPESGDVDFEPGRLGGIDVLDPWTSPRPVSSPE